MYSLHNTHFLNLKHKLHAVKLSYETQELGLFLLEIVYKEIIIEEGGTWTNKDIIRLFYMNI